MTEMYDKIIRRLIEKIEQEMYVVNDKCQRGAESPIEVAMAQAVYLHAFACQYAPYFHSGGEMKIGPNECLLTLQHEEAGYRVDILVVYGTYTTPIRIAIECDGHEFHEKTKEQAAKDKKRDRILSQRFDAILRFTGSEIYRDPWACAEQVHETWHTLDERRDVSQKGI